MKKKIFAFLAVIALLVTMFPVMVMADSNDFSITGRIPVYPEVEEGDEAVITFQCTTIPTGATLELTYDEKIISANNQIVSGSNDFTVTVTGKSDGMTTLTVNVKDSSGKYLVKNYEVPVTVTGDEYTVTFNLNSGISDPIASQTVKYGGKVVEPKPYPTREGYTFGGWFQVLGETEVKWDFDNGKVEDDMELIATWTENPAQPETTICDTQAEYPVNFDSMGGTAVQGQHHAMGEKLTVPANPTKDGYTFSAWYLDKNYTQAWNFDLYTVSGPTTLYAKWTAGSAGAGGSSNPNTADGNMAWPYAAAGLVAAPAIAFATVKRRKMQ